MTRIGLLTPYDGGNLGDGTIQTAVIENFLARDPSLEFLGITLDPTDTTRRHGIPAFPITGLSVPAYSEALVRHRVSRASNSSVPATPTHAVLPSRGLRASIKSIPVLGAVLRFLAGRWRALRAWGPEARHLWRSFQVVRTLDLLLVSGGGQLDEEYGGTWGQPYVLFRWAMLARLAGTPFAVASVGAQRMDRPLSRFLFRVALSSAAYRSFRDPGSKGQVAGWSFTRNDPCVPDLAFSLKVSATTPRLEPGEAGIVGLSPMIYGHKRHWPTARHSLYEEYSRRLAAFAHWLLDRGHSLVLFESSGADRVATADLKRQLLELAGPEIWPRIQEPEVRTVREFFSEVAPVDYVVASRLHGVIMSHMLGKPALAISFDRKVDAHMELLAQEQYRVDIARFEVADLIERFTALERNARKEHGTITERIAQSHAQLDAQYDLLLRLAGVDRDQASHPDRSRS